MKDCSLSLKDAEGMMRRLICLMKDSEQGLVMSCEVYLGRDWPT